MNDRNELEKLNSRMDSLEQRIEQLSNQQKKSRSWVNILIIVLLFIFIAYMAIGVINFISA